MMTNVQTLFRGTPLVPLNTIAITITITITITIAITISITITITIAITISITITITIPRGAGTPFSSPSTDSEQNTTN